MFLKVKFTDDGRTYGTCLAGGGGGGVAYSYFFFIRRLRPNIYPSTHKNQNPKIEFEILATQKSKNIPHSVPLKCKEITPKYSPILLWTKKISTKSLQPKKYSFSWKTPKILKFKILNPKKWPEPTYVQKYQSTPPWGYMLDKIQSQWDRDSPWAKGSGELKINGLQNIFYHVAAFVIPFDLIYNMTMFFKSWI